MNINQLIYELILYGKKTRLIADDDETYLINRILELLKLNDFTLSEEEKNSLQKNAADPAKKRKLCQILEDFSDYAVQNNLIETDTITNRDLFDTALMGLITPPPSVVRSAFDILYKESPKKATDFYYEFSQDTNYIRTDRIAKDEKWVTDTEYGKLDITINLSKPEKDPRDIAAAGAAKKSGYPACLLCMENEGYAGSVSHPARQNHRIIPLGTLDPDSPDKYYLQYSPYVYYNEHCIIFNEKHIPMKIDRSTMKKLLCFVQRFPHYTAGSNADLPIVGGSILSHDHFQGGGYEFPMVRAPYETMFSANGFEDVTSGIIKWPMSTIRLQGDDINRIVELADKILLSWRGYTDKSVFILAETGGVPHNTITPIARMRKADDPNNKHNTSNDVFEIDLVLRNNITTDEHPLGVYHPHAVYHHIKKENIGLIEVMGLAVLPARLKTELEILENAILGGKDLYEDEKTKSHADWATGFLKKYDVGSLSQEGLHKIIKDEVGFVFSGVLEDAGVYKRNKEGSLAFMRFIDNL